MKYEHFSGAIKEVCPCCKKDTKLIVRGAIWRTIEKNKNLIKEKKEMCFCSPSCRQLFQLGIEK